MNLFDLSAYQILTGVYLLLIVLFLVLIALLSFKIERNVTYARKEKWDRMIDDQLYRAILDEDGDFDTKYETSPQFKKHLKSRTFRRYFSKKVLEAFKNFSGSANINMHRLLDYYGLKKDALHRLHGSNGDDVAFALQEVSAMHVHAAYPTIRGLSRSRSPVVQDEAMHALAVFKGIDGLDFLDTHKKQLSDWEQLILLKSVEQADAQSAEKFRQWLKSDNRSVVNLALKFIQKFKIYELYDEVVDKFYFPDHQIQVQSIKTLVAIENEGTGEFLRQHFYVSNGSLQYEIMRAIFNLNERLDSDFFMKQLRENPSPTIKKYAAKALLTENRLGDLEQLLVETDSEETRKIIKQIIQQKAS